jgi:hypothetical protein
MKRRINNQLDADKLRFIDVISSTCFGHHYAHLSTPQTHQSPNRPPFPMTQVEYTPYLVLLAINVMLARLAEA